MLDQSPLYKACDLVWDEYVAERTARQNKKWPARLFKTKRERQLFEATDALEKLWQEHNSSQVAELFSWLDEQFVNEKE